MGFLDTIARAVAGGYAAGPLGAIVFGSGLGKGAVRVAVDLQREAVDIAGEIWDVVPGSELLPDLPVLPGLFKSRANPHLLMLGGPWGFLPGISIFNAVEDAYVNPAIRTATFLKLVRFRHPNDAEWSLVRSVFGNTLPGRSSILLTSFGLGNGRAFVFPLSNGAITINLGSQYSHHGTIRDAALLAHEMTHVWQVKEEVLRDVFFYLGTTQRQYAYTPGAPWDHYGLEMQGSIIGDWVQTGGLASSGLYRYVQHVRKNSLQRTPAEEAKASEGTRFWLGASGPAESRLVFTGRFASGTRSSFVYSVGDWWLGTYETASRRLEWGYLGETRGYSTQSTRYFGNLHDGRPFWTGDFNGSGTDQLLFYYPGQGSNGGDWWLGTYDTSAGQLTWQSA
ncbi:MAG: hypothetical protein AAGA93_16300 [Actinomycetota bacterium]